VAPAAVGRSTRCSADPYSRIRSANSWSSNLPTAIASSSVRWPRPRPWRQPQHCCLSAAIPQCPPVQLPLGPHHCPRKGRATWANVPGVRSSLLVAHRRPPRYTFRSPRPAHLRCGVTRAAGRRSGSLTGAPAASPDGRSGRAGECALRLPRGTRVTEPGRRCPEPSPRGSEPGTRDSLHVDAATLEHPRARSGQSETFLKPPFGYEGFL
jgi:hypothetical protein